MERNGTERNGTLLIGNAKDVLSTLSDESVDCCITSPPYFGLRNYESREQIGLENSPEKYIQRLSEVFAEVRRVLKSDGTLWVVIGDSYAKRRFESGAKRKDLIGIPWMLACAQRSRMVFAK